MKRLLTLVLLILCCSFGQGWAEVSEIQDVKVLPLTRDRALIEIQSTCPVVMEVTRHHGVPAIWLKETQLIGALRTPEQILPMSIFLRLANYKVKTESTDKGTWLLFDTKSPLTLSVAFSDSAFQEEAARELPLYQRWPYVSPETTLSLEQLVDQAYNQFQQQNLTGATASLETLFRMSPEPPGELYQLLGALYLEQNAWVKALLVYGQGAHQYPESLGLRYSALLYRMQQPDKAIQALSDLVMTVGIDTQVMAQAQYMLGSLYEEKKDYAKALPQLKAAAIIFHDSPAVLYNLAISYEAQHEASQAMDTYQKALSASKNGFSDEIKEQIQRLKTQVSPNPGT